MIDSGDRARQVAPELRAVQVDFGSSEVRGPEPVGGAPDRGHQQINSDGEDRTWV